MKDYSETTLSKESLYEGPIFQVQKHKVALPNGKESIRDLVLHQGAVGILALKDQSILLVRQYRKALEDHLWEIPAGKLDKGPQEIPLEAAKRELAEEANLQAKSWTKLMDFVGCPGFCSEKVTLFLAQDLEDVLDGPGLDPDEFLDLAWFSLEQAWQMVLGGQIVDGKTLAAITFGLHHLGRIKEAEA